MMEVGKTYSDRKGVFTPEFYIYRIPFLAITGAAPARTTSIQTQTDADFILVRMNYFFIDAAAATETVTAANVEIPDIDVQITDSASSKNLFFAPMPIASIAANTYNNEVTLPAARLLAAGTSLTASISSTKTFANTYNLTLALVGFKKLRIQS